MLNAKGLLHSEIQCTSEQLRGDVFRTGCTEREAAPRNTGVAAGAAWVVFLIKQQPKAPAWLNITPRIFSVQLHGKRCQLMQRRHCQHSSVTDLIQRGHRFSKSSA